MTTLRMMRMWAKVRTGPPPATREQIVVRQRKRRRALCVDEELVDPDMLSMNASQQQQHQEKQARDDILLREALVMRTPEARECRPRSPLRSRQLHCSWKAPSVHEAGHDLANILGEMFIRRAKRGKRGGGQTAAGRVRDPDGADGLVGDDAAARRAQQDLGQDFYDGNETEQGVELEQHEDGAAPDAPEPESLPHGLVRVATPQTRRPACRAVSGLRWT